MEIILIIIAVVIVFAIYSFMHDVHDNKINERIESIGGKVSNVERRNLFTGLGPFMVVGKGRTVYRIEYRINNQTKEGWVRFGGLLGPDWRL